MADIDLVPGDYYRALRLERVLRHFCAVAVVCALLVALVQIGLVIGTRQRSDALAALDSALARERDEDRQLSQLDEEKHITEQQLRLLASLRGSLAAVDMFSVMDRASVGDVWFTDWTFRRAGEVVESTPQGERAGYFIVLPKEPDGDGKDRAWRMDTHMELRARASDHAALARFVKSLVEQEPIAEARVISTQVRRQDDREFVDFELALVVETQS